MIRTTICLLLLLPAAWGVHGQDCTLGLGGSDPAAIIRAFELDEAQQERLRYWIGALETENTPLQQQLDSLLQSHPQSTPEQLTALGEKFEAIKQQMVDNSLRYDQLLLGIFRPRQYRIYEAMCEEIGRYPLEPMTEGLLKPQEN